MSADQQESLAPTCVSVPSPKIQHWRFVRDAGGSKLRVENVRSNGAVDVAVEIPVSMLRQYLKETDHA